MSLSGFGIAVTSARAGAVSISMSTGTSFELRISPHPAVKRWKMVKSGNNLMHGDLDFDITILDYMDNATLEPIQGSSSIGFKGMLKNFNLIEM